VKKIYFTTALITVIGMISILNYFVSAEESEGAPDTSQMFLQANQAYMAADFRKAAQYYDKIISSGIVNGEVYYNLGNACIKSEDIGKAILNYRKAEMFMPRDEDLRTNLEYASGLTRDRIECRELLSFLKRLCFWYSKLNLNELATLFLIGNFILWAMLSVRIYFKKEILTIALYIIIFLTSVLGVSYGVKIYNLQFNTQGVVLTGEIMVRSGNSINDTVLFKLHEGAEFTWEQKKSGWVKIRLCDGKKGWVQAEVVGKI
jgi:tetratricopeptide (TPR) repeat protein